MPARLYSCLSENNTAGAWVNTCVWADPEPPSGPVEPDPVNGNTPGGSECSRAGRPVLQLQYALDQACRCGGVGTWEITCCEALLTSTRRMHGSHAEAPYPPKLDAIAAWRPTCWRLRCPRPAAAAAGRHGRLGGCTRAAACRRIPVPAGAPANPPCQRARPGRAHGWRGRVAARRGGQPARLPAAGGSGGGVGVSAG
jgi:hypothetical protein